MTLPAPELEMEDALGTVYPLEWPGRHAMEVSGLGLPPIHHWSTRAPFQVGRTHWGYAWGPRTVNLVLYLKGCGRQGYWDGRAANVAMLNPERSPHKLRLTYPNGETFEVHDGWYNAGYELASTEAGHDWQTGAVQMIFYSPIWKWVTNPLDAGETRDVHGRTCVATSTFTTTNALVFPFTGPYLLNIVSASAALTCNNDGTAPVRPVVTVTGPLQDWTLTNTTTGKAMTWDGYDIAAGETVTIDIPNKSVYNGGGSSLSTYLSGDFGTFLLQPGANALAFYGAGGVVPAATTVSVCWYVEALGV